MPRASRGDWRLPAWTLPPPGHGAPLCPAAPPPGPTHCDALSWPLGGEITSLILPDVSRSAGALGRERRWRSNGEPLTFDCGPSGVDIAGPPPVRSLGPGGMLAAKEGGGSTSSTRGLFSGAQGGAHTVARASEIALADGLTCRFAGKGATLAFEGRRASFTCGMKDGDTVTLLGELEPIEGEIFAGSSGPGSPTARAASPLRSSEPILVTVPR